MAHPRKPSFSDRIPFFYGWMILPVASLAMFISGPGQTFSFSVFVEPMRTELGLSQTAVAGLYTAGSLTAAASMVLVGRLLDWLGARAMLVGVGACFGLAALWMSTVDNKAELYIGCTLMRLLGQGALTLVPTTLVALWFIRMRGRVMAINSLGSAVGQAAFPPLIFLLINELGWRDAWVALTFMIWGAIILPSLLVIRRTPESIGLRPDGVQIGDGSRYASDSASIPRESNFSLKQALRTRAFWLLLIAGSSQSLIGTALVFNNESFITSRGLTTEVAASIFIAMAPMVLVGNFAAGFLSDRYPNRYLLAAAQLLIAVPMLWSFLITAPWRALVYGGMLGLGGGFSMTINAVIWPNYYGRGQIGSIRGMATSAMVGFAALGPLPFAFLFELSSDYLVPILVFMILPVISAAAALAAIPPTLRTGDLENPA